MRQMVGMTQAELASRLGLSQPAVSLIERGERPLSLNTLRAIADILGGSLEVSVWLDGQRLGLSVAAHP
ncbi:MAG: helix-turn-helix transcriptional regulator [Acidimicrobiales bacterium]